MNNVEMLILQDLQRSALYLLEDAEAGDAESAVTLMSVITTICYYSTTAQFADFMQSLPDSFYSLLDIDAVEYERTSDSETVVHVPLNSNTSNNFAHLGYVAYMGMAELGFVSIEHMIELAKLGQATAK